jgi:hypothetical protein
MDDRVELAQQIDPAMDIAEGVDAAAGRHLGCHRLRRRTARAAEEAGDHAPNMGQARPERHRRGGAPSLGSD